MLKFHRKVNPKEGLIGFYKTGSEIDESTLAIYGYYLQLLRDPKNKGLLTQPLLFLIDPTMEKNKLTIKVGTRSSAIWPFLNFFYHETVAQTLPNYYTVCGRGTASDWKNTELISTVIHSLKMVLFVKFMKKIDDHPMPLTTSRICFYLDLNLSSLNVFCRF